MSTADNIFILHGLITHLFNEGKQMYGGFVDFSKAFDFVSRDIIWYKLVKLGVRGKMSTIIQSIYENVKSKVKYDTKLSESFDCYLGVRQGECLSPFLFVIYINDLEAEIVNKDVSGVDIGLYIYCSEMSKDNLTELLYLQFG